ncbi:hypothetical protein SK128_015816, partial [Halocaridina rubra]
MKWQSPKQEEEIQKIVDKWSNVCTYKKEADSGLLNSFISSKNLTSVSELESFTGHIKTLNSITDDANETAIQLKDLTSQVSKTYSTVSLCITRLYQVTLTLAKLNSAYAIPFTLIQENLAHRMAELGVKSKEEDGKQDHDEEHQIKKLVDSAIEAIFDPLETRLHSHHKLIVATCFAFAKLDMDTLNEDIVMAFLVPLDKGEDIWQKYAKVETECLSKTASVEVEEEREEIEGENEEENEEETEDMLTYATDMDSDDEEEDEIPSEWIPKQCDVK